MIKITDTNSRHDQTGCQGASCQTVPRCSASAELLKAKKRKHCAILENLQDAYPVEILLGCRQAVKERASLALPRLPVHITLLYVTTYT